MDSMVACSAIGGRHEGRGKHHRPKTCHGRAMQVMFHELRILVRISGRPFEPQAVFFF